MNRLATVIIIVCILTCFCISVYFLAEKSTTKLVRETSYEVVVNVTSRGIAEGNESLVFCNTISLFNEDYIIESQELYNSGVDSIKVSIEEKTYRFRGQYYPEYSITKWEFISK